MAARSPCEPDERIRATLVALDAPQMRARHAGHAAARALGHGADLASVTVCPGELWTGAAADQSAAPVSSRLPQARACGLTWSPGRDSEDQCRRCPGGDLAPGALPDEVPGVVLRRPGTAGSSVITGRWTWGSGSDDIGRYRRVRVGDETGRPELRRSTWKAGLFDARAGPPGLRSAGASRKMPGSDASARRWKDLREVPARVDTRQQAVDVRAQLEAIAVRVRRPRWRGPCHRG